MQNEKYDKTKYETLFKERTIFNEQYLKFKHETKNKIQKQIKIK